MNFLRLAILLIFIVGSLPASAEFYKYVDKNGVALYTDDLSQVPVDQRPGVKEFTESAIKEPISTQNTETPSIAYEQNQEAKEDIDAMKARLERIKQELDQEYQALAKEKQQVAAEKKNIKNYSDIPANNDKIIELNEKIKKYEEKQKAFNQEVKSFNARLKQALNEKPEKTVSGKVLK